MALLNFITPLGVILFIIIVQSLLSKCETWILGSVLPIISLFFGGAVFYSGDVQFNVRTVFPLGVFIVIQLYIWKEGRRKIKERRELELNKMIIRDLK